MAIQPLGPIPKVGGGLDTPNIESGAYNRIHHDRINPRQAPQGDVAAQFIQLLMQQAATNKELAHARMTDARNTGGRHLDMSGHDITNDARPFGGPMTFTPRGERAGLQSLTPHGDFGLLTKAGRAPSEVRPTTAPARAPAPAVASTPSVPSGATFNPEALGAAWYNPTAPAGAGQGMHPDIASAFTMPPPDLGPGLSGASMGAAGVPQDRSQTVATAPPMLPFQPNQYAESDRLRRARMRNAGTLQ